MTDTLWNRLRGAWLDAALEARLAVHASLPVPLEPRWLSPLVGAWLR